MTTATVLSKKQLKKGIGHKKPTIKNVLATPYSNYFPLVQSSHGEDLLEVMRKLPRLKAQKVAVPWKLVKDIPKEERKSFRESHHQKVDVDPGFRSCLVFGVNGVAHLLEKKEASAVLIGDVNPRFLVKHIIDMSVLNKIPVLVVHNLKLVLETSTGIPTICLGVTKSFSQFQVLTEIVKKITSTAANYPVPHNHIHADVSESDSELDETLQNLNLEKREEERRNEVTKVRDLYLYRTDKKSRVFVPENNECEKMETDEFLALETTVDRTTKIKSNYKGMKVKRVKSNQGRKKKIKLVK